MPAGTIELQRKLQLEAFDVDPATLDGEELADFVRWNVLAAVDELCEALHEVKGWKPWSKLEPDRLAVQQSDLLAELVDVQHFINNLVLVAGADDETFAEAYERKSEINLERQQEGYRA